jgi:hypothetical protein
MAGFAFKLSDARRRIVNVASRYNWLSGWKIIQARFGILADSCSIDDFAGLFQTKTLHTPLNFN